MTSIQSRACRKGICWSLARILECICGVAFREHISRVALQCCTACSQLEACCVRNVPRPVFRGSCRVPCSACISMFCHLCSVGSGRVLPASCRSMPAVCFITAGPIRPLEGTPCTVVYPNPFERHLNQMSYRRDTQGPHSNPRYFKFTRKFTDDEDDDAGVTNAGDKAGLLVDSVAGEGPLGHALERKTNAGELGTEREVAAVKGVPGG